MAQLERPQRHADNPKSPTIQTMEQLLRAGEACKVSPTSSSSPSAPSSPFFQRFKHQDSEEDHSPNQKKSVLTKVKEKAKKLRHSLSKKKHEDGNVTSPSGVGLEHDQGEEDAEYLGAPMYESEMAPERYKENAREHPRVSPVITEKHVLSITQKPGIDQHREKQLSSSMSKRTTQPATETLPAANKTIATKTVAEKPAPASSEGSDPANSISSKFEGLTVSKTKEHHISASSFTATRNTSWHLTGPQTPPAKMPSQISSPIEPVPRTSLSAPVTPLTSSSPMSGKSACPTGKVWDKGVSVREYLLNKLEPGEDEKALSQVISEAMSPRRTPGDAGVIEKVREAVTSLLRNEEPSNYAHSKTPMPSQIPVSTSAQQEVEEEDHGKILQAN